MKTANKKSGFTLVEMVITLAVAAILAVTAVPMFRSLIQNTRISTQVNRFVGDLNLARSEAIKRGLSIRVTALAGEDKSNEWGTGWRIWIDSDNNSSFDATKDEEVKKNQSQLATMTLNSHENSGNLTQIGFLPGGMVANSLLLSGTSPTWPVKFELRIADCTGNQGRDITLSRSGSMLTTAANCE